MILLYNDDVMKRRVCIIEINILVVLLMKENEMIWYCIEVVIIKYIIYYWNEIINNIEGYYYWYY